MTADNFTNILVLKYALLFSESPDTPLVFIRQLQRDRVPTPRLSCFLGYPRVERTREREVGESGLGGSTAITDSSILQRLVVNEKKWGAGTAGVCVYVLCASLRWVFCPNSSLK